jgi:L-alanine-DL-glutamate epimerase-like enolase superfamily enzyme
MVDANMAWTADGALERGRRLQAYRPYWFEDPTVPEDVAGHARLAKALDMPIAVGESLHSQWEFERYVLEKAAGVIQVDPVTNGGITVARRVLQLADRAGLPTSSHYTDELCAHLLCASQRPLYLEKHAFALDPYLEEPQHVHDGQARPTETPGHGLRFSPERLRLFAR